MRNTFDSAISCKDIGWGNGSSLLQAGAGQHAGNVRPSGGMCSPQGTDTISGNVKHHASRPHLFWNIARVACAVRVHMAVPAVWQLASNWRESWPTDAARRIRVPKSHHQEIIPTPRSSSALTMVRCRRSPCQGAVFAISGSWGSHTAPRRPLQVPRVRCSQKMKERCPHYLPSHSRDKPSNIRSADSVTWHAVASQN
jgi:hypothetical protein